MPHRKLQKLTRRSLVRLISYGIALIVALGGFTAHGYFLTVRYRTQLEYTYQRALNDLSNYLANINIALKKGLYSGTATQLSSISSELWRDSGSAKACIAQMPTNDKELLKVSKFLSQVGEYSMALSKKVIAGNEISEEERENLVQLSENAASLSGEVNTMQSELSEGRLWLGEVRRVVEKSKTQKDVKSALSAGVGAAEEAMTDYPTLIYDGPYSDHLMKKSSKLLEGKAQVSRDDAKKTAAMMTQRDISKLENDGEEKSATPSYVFTDGDIRAAVTKAGGLGVYFSNPRDTGEATIGYDEALPKAKQYLSKLGYGTFKESYYMTNENVCVINFAYLEGETICSPDLVKVGVALDNGEIVSLDARGYLMNHVNRSLPAPKYTKSQAQAVISRFLKVQNAALAVIPKATGEEKFCYEFACKGTDGEDIYVYINALDLSEEDILILLKIDGGVLTY